MIPNLTNPNSLNWRPIKPIPWSNPSNPRQIKSVCVNLNRADLAWALRLPFPVKKSAVTLVVLVNSLGLAEEIRFVNNLETNFSSPSTANLTPNSLISKSHLHSKPYTWYWPTMSKSRGWLSRFWSWRPWGLDVMKTMGKF